LYEILQRHPSVKTCVLQHTWSKENEKFSGKRPKQLSFLSSKHVDGNLNETDALKFISSLRLKIKINAKLELKSFDL